MKDSFYRRMGMVYWKFHSVDGKINMWVDTRGLAMLRKELVVSNQFSLRKKQSSRIFDNSSRCPIAHRLYFLKHFFFQARCRLSSDKYGIGDVLDDNLDFFPCQIKLFRIFRKVKRNLRSLNCFSRNSGFLYYMPRDEALFLWFSIFLLFL